MNSPKVIHDTSLALPPGLDEDEQYAVMMKADKMGMRRPSDDMTALPAGSPPPGPGWRKGKNVEAPISGKLYTIYLFPHDPPKRGPKGTKSTPPSKNPSHPDKDPGVKSKTDEQKPPTPAGSSDSSSPSKVDQKKKENWLGTTDSENLTQSIEEIRKTLEDPNATEEQISGKIQEGLKQGRTVALLGGDDDPRMGALMQKVAEASSRIGDMRNEEFQKILQQEDRNPGSVSDEKMKNQIQRVLGAERQRELLGMAEGEQRGKALDLTIKGIEIIGDRKADAVQAMLDQDKRAPGSVSEAQYKQGMVDLIGIARQAQLFGIDRPKTNNALESVAEVAKVLIQRKEDARRKLIEQKDVPGSGVTDQQIQDATIELNKLKAEAKSLGF